MPPSTFKTLHIYVKYRKKIENWVGQNSLVQVFSSDRLSSPDSRPPSQSSPHIYLSGSNFLTSSELVRHGTPFPTPPLPNARRHLTPSPSWRPILLIIITTPARLGQQKLNNTSGCHAPYARYQIQLQIFSFYINIIYELT